MKPRSIDEFEIFCNDVVSGNGQGRKYFNQSSIVNVAEKILEDYTNTSGQNHQGHVRQSFYVLYDFFSNHSVYLNQNHYLGIPFDVNLNFSGYLINDLGIFLNDNGNTCCEYNVSNFSSNIPITLGGTSTGQGGSWSPTLKRMIPLVKEYLQ